MRNVVFDLGGVVIEWNPDGVLAGLYADAGLRAAMRAAIFQHPDWLELDRGTLDEPAAIRRFAARTRRPEAELVALMAAVRRSLLPKPDTVALLARLHAQGVPLYALSNMPSATFAHLRGQHGFWDVFRGVVISGDIQLVKPDREIFEHLLRSYSLAPGETIFIDDNLPNVQAARALGMHALHFTDARQCERELDALLGAAS